MLDSSLRIAAALAVPALAPAQDETAQAPATSASPVVEAIESLNPTLTVIGNFVGRLDDRDVLNEEGDRIDSRFSLREVEVDFRAAIDPYAEGVLIVAFGAETPGEYEATVEEGYLDLLTLPGLEESRWFPRIRVGRFRPTFGRMNRLHTHDLPQTTRPLSFQTYFGEEGYASDGFELMSPVPTPGESSELSVTLSLVNGGSIPVAEDNGGNDPAVVARAGWYVDVADEHAVEVGGSAWLGHTDADGQRDANIFGVDLTYTWFPFEEGAWRSVVVAGELYFVDVEDTTGASSTPWGGFGYGQYQFNHHWLAGLRFDHAQSLDETIETRSTNLYVSYYTTEFLRVRGSWERSWSDDPARDGLDTFWIEMNFVFGAHPPHPYWVHR